MYDAVILDYRAGRDDGCKLKVVGSWYSMTGYGIGISKGSKYKELLDKYLIQYINSGELERNKNFWFMGSCEKAEENTRNSHQFGLLQSSSVFFLLCGGVVISFLLLLTHRGFKRYISQNLNLIWLDQKPVSENDKRKHRAVSRTSESSL